MIADAISLLVVFYILAPWFLGQPLWGLGMLFNEFLNHGWHYVFRTQLRPSGASNCNMFNTGGSYKLIPGFPSGHMSHTSTFFTIAFFIYKSKWLLIVGLLSVLFMGWARLKKQCHTKTQVVAGVIIGVIFGCCWTIFSLFFKNRFIHCREAKQKSE
jgi:membrane-associated phospholipid phosphatase